jgi:NDP-sugar pyrophosphorylase family protein
MNPTPTVAQVQQSRDEILELLRQKSLHQIPVLDQGGRLVGLEVIENLLRPQSKDNLVVIMAGGLGNRLGTLTRDCPKPMLRVGGKPILETILENFLKEGFQRFRLAVNYKAEMIREYFGAGENLGCEIQYIQEEEPLGTAGALSLLSEIPDQPLIVMNGDVLTKVDLGRLVDFHKDRQSCATMCVREYDMQVPYGVVMAENEKFMAIEEKPVQKFFINAGLYVLDPEVLPLIPANTRVDMPELFKLVEQQGMNATVFPVMEYWLDLGKMDDFRKAQESFGEVFG